MSQQLHSKIVTALLRKIVEKGFTVVSILKLAVVARDAF